MQFYARCHDLESDESYARHIFVIAELLQFLARVIDSAGYPSVFEHRKNSAVVSCDRIIGYHTPLEKVWTTHPITITPVSRLSSVLCKFIELLLFS